MKTGGRFLPWVLLVLIFRLLDITESADPDPIQDFCVADLSQGVYVNGYPCKEPWAVTADDFHYAGLAPDIDLSNNSLGGLARLAFVRHWPGLNSLGLSLVRLDLVPGGIIMPHTHSLASEVLYVLEGEIYVGFITNSDNAYFRNKLYAKTVKKGEAFIIPRGLLHFQLNNGTTNAISINALNSHNPGLQLSSVALFSSGVDPKVLEKAFDVTLDQQAAMTESLSQFKDLFR